MFLTYATDDMAKKPPKKSNTKKPAVKKKSPRKKKTFDNVTALIAVNAMLTTGTEIGVAAACGVSTMTIHRWKKAHKDFGESLVRAREDRNILITRDFLPEHVTAIQGLNILISGCTKELTTVVEKDLIDNEEGAGKVLQIMERRKTTAQRYYPPDFKAIEKVLGPNDIKHNVYVKAVSNHMLDDDNELYKLIFGDLANDDHGDKYEGLSVLRLGLDLMKLRYMEAHIQHEYDQGNITVESWVHLTGSLRRDFQQITDRMETRAQKLLGGVSYNEILMRVENVWNQITEIIEEAVGMTYDREGGKKPYTVPPDIQKQIVQRVVLSVRAKSEGGLPMLRGANIR